MAYCVDTSLGHRRRLRALELSNQSKPTYCHTIKARLLSFNQTKSSEGLQLDRYQTESLSRDVCIDPLQPPGSCGSRISSPIETFAAILRNPTLVHRQGEGK